MNGKSVKKWDITKIDTRTAMFNMLKGLFALAISNAVGYFIYLLVLRGVNESEPETASVRTVIFGLAVFGYSIFAYLKLLMAESKNEKIINEQNELKEAFKKSEYNLDFDKYFSDVVKKRLWGYYVSAFLWQIPLIINYIIVSANPADITIYELPISIYKFCLSGIFAYEIFPEFWLLGLFIYMASFIIVFTYFAKRKYKKLLVKPSYLK